MALTVADEQRIRLGVRNLIEAHAAAAENPAATPAIGHRHVELGSVVFPVVGLTEKSTCMIQEFVSCIGASVNVIRDVLNSTGRTASNREILDELFAVRAQIGR